MTIKDPRQKNNNTIQYTVMHNNKLSHMAHHPQTETESIMIMNLMLFSSNSSTMVQI